LTDTTGKSKPKEAAMEQQLTQVELIPEGAEDIRARIAHALEVPAGARTSSRAAATSIIPTKKKAQALGVVIDLYRLAMGWLPLDDRSHDAMLVAFYVVLEGAHVPAEHYLGCYRRAASARVERLARGEELQQFSGFDIASEWPGLKAELEAARVSSRKFIAAKARPDCPACFGTGKVHRRIDEFGREDPDGKRHAVAGPCECREIQV
jgi:hypothetical protein